MKQFFVVVFSLLLMSANAQSLDDLNNKYQESQTVGNTNDEIFYLNKIAYHYWDNGEYGLAADKFESLLILTEKQGNISGVRNVLTNLGLVYADLSQFDKALVMFKKSLDMAINQKSKPAIVSSYVNITVVHQGAGNYKEALKTATKALDLATELNQMELVRSCYGMLADIHKELGNSEETMKYFNLYSSFDKHLKNKQMEKMKQETQDQVSRVQADRQKTEAELAEERIRLKATEDTLLKIEKISAERQQIINLQQEREQQLYEQLRSETIIRYLFAGIAVIILVFAFYVFLQSKKTKKINTALAVKNKEIETQRDEIKTQSEKIRASIQYAQRIQNAVLPPETLFEKYLNEYFVLFKPRDIVSGDFYWMMEKNDKLIVAVADCTGHGVPGAFMSMLGVAFLNEIVNKIVENKHIKSLQANEVLMHLREYVIRSLHQEGHVHEAKDGMDIVLVILDKKTGELQFSGAQNPLFLIRDGEVQVFKGDPLAISYSRDANTEFTNHVVQTKPSDIIYMFSDGYQDQFGGKNGRKFMTKRFRSMLLEIHKESLDKQKHILDRTIMEWKKNHDQVDDILVMGIKLDFKNVGAGVKNEHDWSDKTILVAEDTEANYLYLVEALKKTEVQLVRARNGAEAVDIALMRNDIDLVLMDVNMPEMDGFEATERIKEKKRKIPIVIQTALNMADVEQRARQVGCDDIIYKPIKLKLFLRIINKYINT